jgi:hypothetical protein
MAVEHRAEYGPRINSLRSTGRLDTNSVHRK